jgi:hypothetical protein
MSSIRIIFALVTAFLLTNAFSAVAVAAPPDFAGLEFEPFAATVDCTGVDPNTKYISCFFDVPPGKILHVERIDGYAENGEVNSILIAAWERYNVTAYRIPNIAPFANPNEFRWEANGDFYVSDNDTIFDQDNNLRDMRVMVYSAGTGSRTGSCNIQGKLYDAPAQ